MPRKRICLVCADPATFDAFLLPHALRLGADFDVSVVCNGRPRSAGRAERVRFHSLGIKRAISPLSDSREIFSLSRLFRRERFEVVHSFTPKAGLLAMMAARIVRVPRRLHTFTGQVWVTKHGAARWLLQRLDGILVRCATHVMADSPSQADFLAKEKIVARARIFVIGDGSICGVNLDRFKPDAAVRRAVRTELGIPADALHFLFLARFKRCKGVGELARAFRDLAARHAKVHLTLVGPDEENLWPELKATLGSCLERVRFVGMTTEHERYLAAADVLCLPSHREGFGKVLIDAAAAGCPAIASRIYGVTDAVEDGRTGLLHPPGDLAALTQCLERFIAEPWLARQMGRAARERVEKLFPEQRITDGLAAFYHAL